MTWIVRTGLTVALAAALAFAGAVSAAQALTGREIMEKVDARDDGDNRVSELEMILIDRRGRERVRRVRSYSRDQGRDTQSLLFFLAPADVRRTGFLTYDYYAAERDDDQWLFLPALRKTKRIASSDKSGSFMGTDFSYADMTRRVLSEWKFRLITKTKMTEVRGHPVWLIEALPASDAVRERYGYTKSLLLVRKDIFMVVRGINWVQKGGKLKFLDVRKVERIDGIWVGTDIHMKTVKAGRTEHQTVLRYSNIRFNQKLGPDTFTIRRLERGE